MTKYLTKSPLDVRAFAREPWALPKWVRSAAITGLWCDAMWCVIRCVCVTWSAEMWGAIGTMCHTTGRSEETGHGNAAHGSIWKWHQRKMASKVTENLLQLQLTCWMVPLLVQGQVWIFQILTCSHMLWNWPRAPVTTCFFNLGFVTPWSLMCPSHWFDTWWNCLFTTLPNVEDLRGQPSMLCFNTGLGSSVSYCRGPYFDQDFPTEIWRMVAVPTQEHDSSVILIPEWTENQTT